MYKSETQRGLGWSLRNPNISEVGRGRDGREEVFGGSRGWGHWASNQDKRREFQEKGMINHQVSPMNEKELWAKKRGLLVREWDC